MTLEEESDKEDGLCIKGKSNFGLEVSEDAICDELKALSEQTQDQDIDIDNDMAEFERQGDFLSNTPLVLSITEAEFSPRAHLVHPYVYTIEVRHGPYKWTIYRRFDTIHQLHRKLQIARVAIAVKTKSVPNRVPKIPRRPEATIKHRRKGKRMERVERLLRAMIAIDVYRINKHTARFFEISPLSFHINLGQKEKEGMVWKRVSEYNFACGAFRFGFIDCTWHRRWLVLKKNFVAYMDKDREEVRGVLLFDSRFEVERGIQNTALLISNSERSITVHCSSKRDADEWVSQIDRLLLADEYSKKGKRYGSFAPQRANESVKWYVDGRDYFADVMDAILMAKEEIFITDWWLTPELLLTRSQNGIAQNRLDQLLKQKADEGVKIYVLIYKEIELTLYTNSFHSKCALKALHSENIKILRHPDHVGGNVTLYYAHHEKIVCIDQNICFLGGFDLCLGRWDDCNHNVTDFGSMKPAFMKANPSFLESDKSDKSDPAQDLASKIFIGKDYTNPYIADPPGLENPFVDYLDRETQPRMPWHDIGAVVVGEPARDVGRHFIQRWNFTKDEKAKERDDYPYLLPKLTSPNICDYIDILTDTHNCNVQILRSSSQWSSGNLQTENSILQAYLDKIKTSKYYIYIENQFFITGSLPDDEYVENKIGDALVERITRAHQNKETFRVYVIMPLLPSFPGVIGEVSATTTCFVEHWNLRSSRRILNQLHKNGVQNPSEYIFFSGLRNFADYDVKKFTEIVYVHSKLMMIDDNAVIIGSANINDRSMLGDRDSEIAICIEDGEKIWGKMDNEDIQVGAFAHSLRVQLFREHLGLLAESFQGDRDSVTLFPASDRCSCSPNFLENEVCFTPANTKAAVSSLLMNVFSNSALFVTTDCSRNSQIQDGEIGGVSTSAIDLHPDEIIDFSVSKDVTEKESNDKITPTETPQSLGVTTVVVTPDDKESPSTCIPRAEDTQITINTEIAETESGSSKEEDTMSISKPSPRHSIICKSFPEDKPSSISLKDPTCHEFWQHAWIDRAKKNTAIYEEVFRCFPTDEVTSFDELEDYRSRPRLEVKDPIRASSMLKDVQGFLVEKPLKFLSDQNLWPEAGSKESLVPVILFI